MDIVFDPQLTIGDMYALENLAKEHRPYTAIEVGSWKGLSTGIIARFASALYCVDTWEAAKSTPGMEAEASNRDIFTVFRHNICALGLWDKVFPMLMPSIQAAALVRDESADFVFIDADHAYLSVYQDIRAWMPKVKKGGILCGHDCDQLWSLCSKELQDKVNAYKDQDFIKDALEPGRGIHPGVTKAINEIFDDQVTVIPGSSVWWIRKQ